MACAVAAAVAAEHVVAAGVDDMSDHAVNSTAVAAAGVAAAADTFQVGAPAVNVAVQAVPPVIAVSLGRVKAGRTCHRWPVHPLLTCSLLDCCWPHALTYLASHVLCCLLSLSCKVSLAWPTGTGASI